MESRHHLTSEAASEVRNAGTAHGFASLRFTRQRAMDGASPLRTMHIYTHTEAGRHRPNEDYLLVRAHPDGGDCTVCLLADGMGGRANGAAAARAACEAAWTQAAATSSEQLLRARSWQEIFKAADRAAQAAEGFTTLVGLAVKGGRLCGGSCGDSRAYGIGPAGLVEWTTHQGKNPPVGSGVAACKSFEGCWAGRLLVVSDGVWKYAGQEALLASFALRDGPAVGVFVRQGALPRPGGPLPDDFSLVLLESLSRPQR